MKTEECETPNQGRVREYMFSTRSLHHNGNGMHQVRSSRLMYIHGVDR